MKILMGVAVLVLLAGCKAEDNSPHSMSTKYQQLEFAYGRCLGDLRLRSGPENFDKRLACTQAVYGGAR